MIVLDNILLALAFLLYGFLWGSIPNGVIVGKLFFQKDLRDYGSHNSGGTNAGRVFGKRIGIAVIVLDILKTLLAFWSSWAILTFTGLVAAVPLYDGGALYLWLVPFAAALGHCFSPWLRFRGGKAVSCYMALIGGPSWLGFLVAWAAFLPVFLKKHIMSQASLVSGGILLAFEWLMALIVAFSGWNGGILMWTFGLTPLPLFGWEAALAATLTYLLLVLRHKPNIERLSEGKEEPLRW